MKKFYYYDINRGNVKVHLCQKVSKRETERLEKQIEKDRLEYKHKEMVKNITYYSFLIIFFILLIIIKHYIFKW